MLQRFYYLKYQHNIKIESILKYELVLITNFQYFIYTRYIYTLYIYICGKGEISLCNKFGIGRSNIDVIQMRPCRST